MPPFVFPRQRYGCIQCGKSCGHWRIWVEPQLVQSLREHPLALRLEVAGRSYLQIEEGGWHRLGYDEQGRCFFLQDGHLCGLHATTGWESKPRACRQFPFFLLETPDGIQVGLSFRCTAVQQDAGPDWESHRADLAQLVASGSYAKVGFQPAWLGSTSLSWDDYLGWETGWIQQLQSGHPLALGAYSRLQPVLGLLLDRASFEGLLDQWSASAVALLEGDREIAALLLAEEPYTSPRRGPVAGLEDPFLVSLQADSIRYLSHVLQRKSLWMGPLLGKLLLLLVGERLLHYYARSLNDLWAAVDLVEGEWLAHRPDLGPLEESLAASLLHFC